MPALRETAPCAVSAPTGTAGGIRLLVVDDHPVVCSGIVQLLGREPGIDVVGEARDGARAVELAAATRPDVVLMDLRMPAMSGVEATRRIRALPNPAQVVILTTYEADSDVSRAVEAGAIGYLLKDSTREQIAEAVRTAALGRSSLSPEIAARLLRASRRATERACEPALSPRETQVLGHVAQGLSNAQIGARLFVSEATVKTHLLRAYTKLGVDSRAAAVAEAIRRGALEV